MSEGFKCGMGWVVIGSAVFGAPKVHFSREGANFVVRVCVCVFCRRLSWGRMGRYETNVLGLRLLNLLLALSVFFGRVGLAKALKNAIECFLPETPSRGVSKTAVPTTTHPKTHLKLSDAGPVAKRVLCFMGGEVTEI